MRALATRESYGLDLQRTEPGNMENHLSVEVEALIYSEQSKLLRARDFDARYALLRFFLFTGSSGSRYSSSILFSM